MNLGERIKSLIPGVILLVLVNIAIFMIGNFDDNLFIILQQNDQNIYSVNNSALAGVLALLFLNVISIYHGVVSYKLKKTGEEIENEINKHTDERLSRLQAHLINYDEHTLHFNNLSAIESEIGTDKESIHNEIWILTNNFEESHDSKEGREIREAMLKNLRHNVDYFYIIPSACLDEVNELAEKLIGEANGDTLTGRFLYITDDALNFIPTAYFDIIMYIQTGKNTEYTEKNSQVYYCFSRITDTDDYYYQKVDDVKEKEIWERMMRKKEDYKKQKASSFVQILGPDKAKIAIQPAASTPNIVNSNNKKLFNRNKKKK